MAQKKKASPRWTVEQVIDSFERSLKANNQSPYTISGYLISVNMLVRYLETQGLPLFLDVIDTPQLQSFIIDQRERLSDSTAATRYRGIQAFFKWCAAEELIPASPMLKMKPPKEEEKLPTILTDEQLSALFKTCSSKSFVDIRDLAIMRMLLDTGLRLSELNSITLENLDMKRSCVLTLGKGKKWRWCSFGAKTGQALDRYLRVRRQHAHEHLPNLWLGQRGTITNALIQLMLSERGHKVGIVGLHPHLFRHTFIDRMKRSGMTEENIMQLTGHSSTEVFQHYAKGLRAERAMEEYRHRAPGDKI